MDKALNLRHQKRLAHRHYLSYDGVGSGTYSERERQYTQSRLDHARESVFEKKFQEALINNEAKEVSAHSGEPKSTKSPTVWRGLRMK